jgi:hypothetical protein
MLAYKSILLSGLLVFGFAGNVKAIDTDLIQLDSVQAYTMLSSQTADSGPRRPRRDRSRRYFSETFSSKATQDVSPERGSGRRDAKVFFPDINY